MRHRGAACCSRTASPAPRSSIRRPGWRPLADAGYAALRFDFTGLGASEGEFAGTTVTHDVRDLIRAAAALIERGYGPCAMVGHSLGGAAVLLAASRLKTVRWVAVVGAPASPTHVRHLLADGEEESNRAELRASTSGTSLPLLDTDHLVTSRAAADRLAAVLLDWFDATLM